MEFTTLKEIDAVYDFLCDFYTQTEQPQKIETLDAIMWIEGNEQGLADFIDYYWRTEDEIRKGARLYDDEDEEDED